MGRLLAWSLATSLLVIPTLGQGHGVPTPDPPRPAGSPAPGADPVEPALERGLDAYRRRDYAAALREWQPLAERGEPRAQYRLGRLHAAGEGVPRSEAEAVRWFRLAADQGEATAQYELGLAYEAGRAAPFDLETAYMWFELAAARAPEGETRAAALERLNLLARRLAGPRLERAQRMARDWRPGQAHQLLEAIARSAPAAGAEVSPRPGAEGPAAPSAARIYLAFGLPIDADAWWESEGLLFYRRAGVTHGVALRDLVRIEDPKGAVLRGVAGSRPAEAVPLVGTSPAVPLTPVPEGPVATVPGAPGPAPGASEPGDPPRAVGPTPRELYRDVLRLLVGLRGLATGGGDPHAYAARLREAKSLVERLPPNPEPGEAKLQEARSRLAEALGFYETAGAAWQAKTLDTAEAYLQVGRDGRIRRCGRTQALAQKGDALDMGFRVAHEGFQGLLGCAGDQLREAERLLSGPS